MKRINDDGSTDEIIGRTRFYTIGRSTINGHVFKTRWWEWGAVEFELCNGFAKWQGYKGKKDYIDSHPSLAHYIKEKGSCPKWIAFWQDQFFIMSR
ncbi:hypothetical protein M2134_002217 [Parabacteroides sp. PM6-13]|uniref:hypothetical protein n=2 Tax=unclassified Parabacteroides TaxID=2649774 RepID=UPI00247399BE|nr:hypothetical protein [Parabacteroides sp. PM6-13]MDH6343332.1 hypothetical protein [Parabacteroides sp. PM6-13]